MYSFDFEKMNNVSRTDMYTCETVTWLYVGVRKPFTFEVGISVGTCVSGYILCTQNATSFTTRPPIFRCYLLFDQWII